MKTNCRNCGAVLVLEQFADSLICEYCSTLHIPSLREEGEIKIIDSPVGSMRCPVCITSLSNAAIDEWQFQYCAGCHGILLEGEDLLNIIVYMRRDSSEPYRDPEPINAAELQRTLNCPDCGGKMAAHPYYGPGDFVIDSCSGCGGVWLDCGKLNRAATVKWGGFLWK